MQNAKQLCNRSHPWPSHKPWNGQTDFRIKGSRWNALKCILFGLPVTARRGVLCPGRKRLQGCGAASWPPSYVLCRPFIPPTTQPFLSTGIQSGLNGSVTAFLYGGYQQCRIAHNTHLQTPHQKLDVSIRQCVTVTGNEFHHHLYNSWPRSCPTYRLLWQYEKPLIKRYSTHFPF